MKNSFKREKELWIISIPMVVWVIIFAYIPLLGLSMAFFKYTPGQSLFNSSFVGLKYFKEFFMAPDFFKILRNTLAISFLGLCIGFPAPIILALLLNELRNAKVFKKIVQTVSYLPNFISWVVTASILFTILSTDGVLNAILLKTGTTKEPIMFLGEGKYFWGILTSANLWKGVGWSSIIYLSAMAGINEDLYDAGAIDGLGRWKQIWHITLPSIRHTIVLLLILAIASILNAGFEQQLLIGNPQTREYWDVIDTYAYRYGIQMGRFSYATAVGLIKSIIAIILIFSANKFAKKKLDVSIM